MSWIWVMTWEVWSTQPVSSATRAALRTASPAVIARTRITRPKPMLVASLVFMTFPSGDVWVCGAVVDGEAVVGEQLGAVEDHAGVPRGAGGDAGDEGAAQAGDGARGFDARGREEL